MEVFANIILNIIDSIVFLVLFSFFTQSDGFVKKNVLKSIIFIFMYTLLLTIMDFIIPDGIKTFINIIIMVLLLSFITRTNLIASFIATAIIFMLLFTIEILVLFVLMLVLKMDIGLISATFSTRMLGGIIIKALEALLALLIIKSNLRIKKLGEWKKPDTLLQLMALQSLMIAIIIISLTYVTSYKSNILLYNVFIVVVYLLFLLLYYIDYKERERLQAIQNRFKVQDEYIKNMENIINIIRREKHDFSNHLNTILAMCTLNKPDTVQKIGNYIRKLSVKLISSYHFFNTGNDYVDGLLAVKSNIAFEHGIQLEADFNVPLKNLDVGDCDITSIIGNITDNAFEAIVSTGDSEGKKISIRTFEDNTNYYISISNNGPVILEKDINKIFASGFSTKKAEKSDHGFGLYIVQQLIQRYHGIITVTSTDEKTEFLIRFVKDGKTNGKTG